MLLDGITFATLAWVMAPTPINDGLTANGLLLYVPNDFTINCTLTEAGECKYSATVGTGVGLELDMTSNWPLCPPYCSTSHAPYVTVAEGYGKYADLIHRQVVHNTTRAGREMKVTIDHTSRKRKGHVTFTKDEPMLVISLQEVTVFWFMRRSQDGIHP